MKALMGLLLLGSMNSVFAVTWTYQVNINNNPGAVRKMDAARNTFEASAHYCEVTPVNFKDGTEYRTLTCGVGTSTVSTGGLCTQNGAKFPSVQYAILNINGPKQLVNIVVACSFE